MATIPIDRVEFIKELYPRLREDDAAIERYRAALDKLPPIAVARGRVLVDGFHRWQAHRREGVSEIAVENLGDITDAEIVREAYRRNAHHGVQLSTPDKLRAAQRLYLTLDGSEDARYAEIADLLSIAVATAKEYARESRRHEKQQQQEKAWDLWLNCLSYRDISKQITGPDEDTIGRWVSAKTKELGNADAPESRQHFDIWEFAHVLTPREARQRGTPGRTPQGGRGSGTPYLLVEKRHARPFLDIFPQVKEAVSHG